MEAIDLKPDPTRLLYLLRQATNIPAKDLAYAFHTDKRTIRSIIHDLRLEGHLITSGDEGYSLCTTLEEFERFEAREMASINNRLKPLGVMRKVAECKFGKQKGLF